MYSDKYMKHFTAPQNAGEVIGPDASAEVKHEGGGCLDRVRMTMKVENDTVAQLKYQLRACSGTIAASSAITSLAAGKPLEEAERIGVPEVLEELGGVPKKKIHSVELAVKALQAVIANYRARKGG